ncbi:unnamed protein product [Tilletia controversa]|uniref:60S acidic ribosomal protein P2 n=3 Tax=Tilletia TaxID=13289 RepID=A0A8X7MMB8_9BASI|nr:hypothetical protein CF336_g7008 [Tilletia laevis]KAE8241758.1 hypothetical protein A4X06_0g7413 [Tilletia controversa]KAE8254705.1 hypothetical protein A4X03_0g5678 [Tilletia caries]KAE8190295.1 hypothetical protein CF335_g6394 [Tilletia laevis]CAD6885924.1 unnamed protein product [Tilletia caries]
MVQHWSSFAATRIDARLIEGTALFGVGWGLSGLRPGPVLVSLGANIAAYLLLQSAGNAAPTTDDITKVLAAADIEPDTERLNKLLSKLQGKDICEIIAEDEQKLASVPSGGGDGGAAAPAAAAGGAAPAEAKKEEAKEEQKEESDDDVGFGLSSRQLRPCRGRVTSLLAQALSRARQSPPDLSSPDLRHHTDLSSLSDLFSVLS